MADYFEDPAVCKWTERSTYSGRLADHMNQLLSAGKFNFAPGDVTWVDELADPWGPTGRYGRCYGRSPLMDAQPDFDAVRSLHRTLFNTEGEKPMAEIDWKKPLRVYPHGERNKHQKVYTFKSGKQRVVWIDDRVYPVDDDGRTVAEVWYNTGGCQLGAYKGHRIVENVPEEKFFVGLARDPDGQYWLTNGGMTTTKDILVNVWEPRRGDAPHWIVDTRQSAEPPWAVKHNPKDWAVIFIGDEDDSVAVLHDLMTEHEAIEKNGNFVVRVRDTPAPADTARYIQLYRKKNSDGAWKINGWPAQDDRQEHTWQEAQNQMRTIYDYCVVKVRD